MSRSKVVVTDYSFPSLAMEKAAAEELGASFAPHQCRTADEVVRVVEGANVVLTQHAPVHREALVGLAPGATVVRYGVGVDNVDVDAAQELGVMVVNVPDYSTDEVADHAVSLLLTLLRKLPWLDRSVREGVWDAVAAADPLPPFARTVVGVLGLGRIGQAVIRRLQPFGFQLLAHDPWADGAVASSMGVELVELPQLLPRVDALTLHIPLTDDTHHILNADRLRLMKPTSVIVNTARGGLVDEQALTEALTTRRIAAAALDVFEEEPLPTDSPFRRLPNVVLTPHAAWYSDDSLGKLQALAADEVRRALTGELPRSPVFSFS